ncbi:MAG: hypothetical protein MJZ16_09555 [Bacteroidales bacterium]|nr:hypothetical protein [Bacteroidales bacterium]
MVKQFVSKCLSNDLSNLASFDLGTIRDHSAFGNSDKHQGIEDMKICKAICYLLDSGSDTDITYDKLLFGHGYEMKLIASSSMLCEKVGVSNEEDLHLLNLPIDLLERLDSFKEHTYTIGNVYAKKIQKGK